MKKNYHKIITAIIIAIIGCSFAFLNSAKAEETPKNSMFVTPMTQELSLMPGEHYEGIISVSNAANSQDDLKYSVEIGAYSRVRDEGGRDDYGAVDVTSRSPRNEMMDWIKLGTDHGLVEPNGTQEIPFTIDVPKNAPAGAQYASILVVNGNENPDNEEAENEDSINIQNIYQLASAIIANIDGTTIEKGSITDNSIPSFLTTGPLEATSTVKNEGNIYTNAEYTLQVWPLFSDEEICTNEEKPEVSMVLPDTERYHAQTCELPLTGIFKTKQVVKIFNEESIVEKTVIVCPIWLLFIILFVIAAIIIWIVMRARSHKKSSKRQTPETEKE